MILQTERLVLRPWYDTDAESLFEYAKDERVGPIAGWSPHKSIEYSRDIIKNILSANENYAICLKHRNRAIGSVGLMIGKDSNLDLVSNEAEIGYWIGVPFWGQGFASEAVIRLISHAFYDLNLKRLWCGYFDVTKDQKEYRKNVALFIIILIKISIGELWVMFAQST